MYLRKDLEQQGHVGQRRQADEGHGLLGGEKDVAHGLDRALLAKLGAVRRGEFVALHAGGAVDVARVLELLDEGTLGARGHRHVRPKEVDELQGVVGGVGQAHVAADGRDETHVKLRRVERDRDGHGVVDAGIRVDDDGLTLHEKPP